MVKGGTVEVRGTIGTSPEDTATAGVHVVGRTDWAGKMIYPGSLPPPQVDAAGEENFPHSPVTVDVDGGDHWVDGALGKYTFGIAWRGYFSQVQTGPNKGWWYLKSPPLFQTPEVWLSTFLEPGDPFYEAQTGKSAGDRSPPRGYGGWCTKADMDKLKQEVLDHEGAISGPRLSHHEFNVEYFRKHDPGPEVEDVVFYLTDQNRRFSEVADSELGRALLDQVKAANDAAVHAKSNLYTVPCKVHLP